MSNPVVSDIHPNQSAPSPQPTATALSESIWANSILPGQNAAFIIVTNANTESIAYLQSVNVVGPILKSEEGIQIVLVNANWLPSTAEAKNSQQTVLSAMIKGEIENPFGSPE